VEETENCKMAMTTNWHNIDEGLFPEPHEPVLLAKEPTEEFVNKCRLGRIVSEDNTGEKGWFVDNEFGVITLSSRKYWAHLIEKPLGVPDSEDENILEAWLKGYMSKLASFEKKFQKLAECMISSGKGIYPLDYYVSGVLNRSLSLIYGFETLIASANFISAVHLVRPHLDNYLRLSAAWLVEQPHDFANRVWKGDVIRKMKDRDGKFMTDAYLKEKAAIDYPWITDVYEASSGFIHFSNKHIMNATSLSTDNDNALVTFIGKTDNNVSYHSKLEAVIGMIEISNCISNQVFGWVDTKRING